MPYGEARNSVAAYSIAVVEAVTSIREVKAKELLGSEFTYVPYWEIGERVEMDHLSFVKEDPGNVARYLDRCIALLNSLFDTPRTLVNEIETMLEDFTDHNKVVDLRRKMDEESKRSNSRFLVYSYMETDEEEPEPRIPIETRIAHTTHISQTL